jgi:Septum formation
MRHAWVLGVAALALAGCAPAGTDGNLTNGWAAFPAAKTPTPVVGACYPAAYQPTWKGDFSSAVDCATKTHETETVFVGGFTGADADGSAPPAAGSDGRRSAFAQCVAAAHDYLGGDWTDAKLTLGLVVPDDAAWHGGARWYRCDVEQYKDSALQTRATEGSVKGGLTGARPLAITCITVTDDGKGSVTGWTDVSCDQPHNGEYAGSYTASDAPWPSDVNTRHNLAKSGCESMVAQFLGFSGTTFQSTYLGWLAAGFEEDRWTAGDRTERCYVLAITGNSANTTRILGSVKGLRDGAPHKA